MGESSSSGFPLIVLIIRYPATYCWIVHRADLPRALQIMRGDGGEAFMALDSGFLH